MNTQVAQTIAQQIGGRAFAMMGTRFKVAHEDALSFDVRGSKQAGKIVVRLDPSDTYTVEFWKMPIARYPATMVHSVEGVYCDGLHQVIEQHTGLCLSLGVAS